MDPQVYNNKPMMAYGLENIAIVYYIPWKNCVSLFKQTLDSLCERRQRPGISFLLLICYMERKLLSANKGELEGDD